MSFLISLPRLIPTFTLSRLIHWVKENRTLSLGLLLGFIILYVARYLTSPYRKVPPGPRGYPIIGNVLELRSQQWLKFTEWRKQYGGTRFQSSRLTSLMFTPQGNVIYLNAAGQPMVILNSQKVAADLLDRRAGIYSDRPSNIVASDIMTGGLLVVFTRYNDMFVSHLTRVWHDVTIASIQLASDAQGCP
jgi:hypothetical protein